MKVLKPAAGIGAGIGAVLLYGVIAGDIVVQSDPGGNVVALYTQYYQEWQAGHRHRIEGACYSACAMRLAFPSTCVGPRARIGLHKAYYISVFGWKIGSPWGTQYMLERLPPNVVAWVNKKGGLTHDMLYLEGEELDRLVRRC
jgi:hypothetical protein